MAKRICENCSPWSFGSSDKPSGPICKLGGSFQPLETDGEEADCCKDEVVVLTSNSSLDKRIMQDSFYYKFPTLSRQKHPKPVAKLRFVRVLVDEAHEIRGVTSAFFKNLVKHADDGASIWFITAASLLNGGKILAGRMKCWDATASVKQVRDPLSEKFDEIVRGYNNVFRQNAIPKAKKQQADADSTRKEMDGEVENLAEIMLRFTIQRTRDASFMGNKIFEIPPSTTEDEWMKFRDNDWQARYQAFYS